MADNYPNESHATALMFEIAQATEVYQGEPYKDDDGVIRSCYLERKGDRLFTPGEPEVWFNISGSGAPETDYLSGADLPHKVQHLDAPMSEFHGWHETENGWLLISSSGEIWQPEAYVPEDDQ